MTINETIKVLEQAKVMGKGEDIVLFSNDEEGNTMHTEASLQMTQVDEGDIKTAFVFYPTNRSNIAL